MARVGMTSRAFCLASLVACLGAIPVAKADEPTCPAGHTCVPDEDMKVFVQLLKEKKCLLTTKPEFNLDTVSIVTDQDGRVYYSGAAPKPYRVEMTWCSYQATATGRVELQVARRDPPTWGFRFRPKFWSGFLPVEAFRQPKALDAVDVGLALDLFHVRDFNLNVSAGIRSVGVDVGLDLTKNFGAFAGYRIAYDGWMSNPALGLYFAF